MTKCSLHTRFQSTNKMLLKAELGRAGNGQTQALGGVERRTQGHWGKGQSLPMGCYYQVLKLQHISQRLTRKTYLDSKGDLMQEIGSPGDGEAQESTRDNASPGVVRRPSIPGLRERRR